MRMAGKNRLTFNTYFYGRSHTNLAKLRRASKISIDVEITNLRNKEFLLFKGKPEASKYLSIGESTSRRYNKNEKLYLDGGLQKNIFFCAVILNTKCLIFHIKF